MTNRLSRYVLTNGSFLLMDILTITLTGMFGVSALLAITLFKDY